MKRNLMMLLGFFTPVVVGAQDESKSAEQFVAELDDRMIELLKDLTVPGAAVAIIENGEIIFQECYGFSDVDNEILVDAHTGFNIGSISKTVAAWGVMKLAQEGKIDLDAPAEQYLSRWHLPESQFDSNEVTIRRLLSHTAGLSLHGYPGWSPADKLPTLEESLNGKNNGPGRVEIILEPGTKFKYSGGGYTILQLIIEEVTGQEFADYMQAQILDPLGMTRSSYSIDSTIMARSSLEHDNFGEAIDFELFTAQAAAGLHTTIEDFTQFALASLYQKNNREEYTGILPNYVIQYMMEAVPQADGYFGYGLGYEVDDVEPMVLTGHGGDNTGWHAIFRVNPESNDGFVVLTNGGRGNTICYQVYCDWVNWKRGKPLGDWCALKLPVSAKVKELIESHGCEKAAEAYWELKKDHLEEYDFSESQLNELGYHYMVKGDLEKAIAVFKLNVEAFPYAFNVYDSLGEALLVKGNNDAAIENYKKSVQLNPDNENGKTVLSNLGVSSADLLFKIPEQQLRLLEGEYLATHDKSWKIVVEVDEGVLKCEDKYYQFTLIPIGDNRFVNPQFGALWSFGINDQDAIPLMIFGKYQFEKIK